MISSTQEQFTEASAVGPDNIVNQATMKQVREQSSKQNFTIGTHIKPQFYQETSTGAAFNAKDASQQRVEVPDLRATNFNVGNDKLSYKTTTNDNQSNLSNCQGSLSKEQKEAQRERMLKARKAQFQYGRDQTDYQTSVA